jgi:hypothetical protein
MRPLSSVLAKVLMSTLLLTSSYCWAANALVVHDGTPGIEADALANLTTHLVGKGFTVTPNVGVPAGSLATYEQVWDIRFNNTTPLTASNNTAYITYMAGGGSLFVMGENLGFNVRDDSIVALVAAAGGGNITYATPQNQQNVLPPFTGPSAIPGNQITYQAAAGALFPPGNGAIVSFDPVTLGDYCTACVWGPGRMSNAPNGSLIVVFDVNFLQAGAAAPLQALTNNLISYLAAPSVIPPQSLPIPSSILLVLLGACGIVAFEMRRRRRYNADTA